jgi:hypothetical protein
MFIAMGFPTSAREAGAVVLYAGLDRAAMLKACDEASASKKFQRIGKLLRPMFQKHSLQRPVDVKVDCSAAHNDGLRAERNSLAAGCTELAAAIKGGEIRTDASKVFAETARNRATEETAKFLGMQKEGEGKIAAAPMNEQVKRSNELVIQRGRELLQKVLDAAHEAELAYAAAARDLAEKRALADAEGTVASEVTVSGETEVDGAAKAPGKKAKSSKEK